MNEPRQNALNYASLPLLPLFCAHFVSSVIICTPQKAPSLAMPFRETSGTTFLAEYPYLRRSTTREICDWCNNRTIRLIPKCYRESYVEDSRTFEHTNSSAREGCQICTVLCAGLVAVVGQPYSQIWIRTKLVPSLDKSAFTLEFRYSETATRSNTYSSQYPKSLEFCSPTGKNILRACTRRRRNTITSPAVPVRKEFPATL